MLLIKRGGIRGGCRHIDEYKVQAKGYIVTSKTNGNSIFLPSNDSSVIDGKETGFGSYWSSTPCNDITFDTYGRYAGAIGFYAKDYNISDNVRIQSVYFLRWCKRGIRPVDDE